MMRSPAKGRTMGDLTAADFTLYFWAVHGQEPYPWQTRLTRQVLEEGDWPDVIDLPTGAGKTAVLDTAVFALAVKPDISPRRIMFVIDRRIVVDQVYERARAIAGNVSTATEGVLVEVNRRLKELTGDEELLGVAALRGGLGGIPLVAEWARRPEQPWVMVSTVDQFGSRLLFRGYGTSPRMRPVFAGLAGNDCLVILDEVHLSQAFAATLRDISSDGEVPLIRSVNSELLPRRFSIVEMSATPTNANGRRFALQDGDLEQSPRLRQIAKAAKRATLVTVSGNRPAHESVPKKVLELIDRKLSEDERSVGVVVNRVRTARETQRLLQRHGYAAHLVTGRMRPIDKGEVLTRISQCVDPDRDSLPNERTVVIATQAIEVGADFSFDALISEAAPIDSLRQRLGRLDRRGNLAARRNRPARCWILGVASEMKPSRPDPVYGHATRRAWEELQSLASGGEIDVGPGTDLLARLNADALAPKPEAPLLLPTHVDAWSQTSPDPVTDPPIADFLHGKDSQREPDVSVVWRRDRSDAALHLVPPRPAEYLAVPVSAVGSWIRRTAETPIADTGAASSDDGVRRPGKGDGEAVQRQLRGVRRWVGSENGLTEAVERVDQIKPGDLIVADPAMGGLWAGTWDPSARPSDRLSVVGDDAGHGSVEDLGDQAQLAYRQRATLRLDPRLLEELDLSQPPGPQDEQDALTTTPESSIDHWLSELRDLPTGVLPIWMTQVIERLRSGRFDIETVGLDTGSGYYVLVERAADPAILDDFDDKPSLTGSTTELRDHLGGVGATAERYGRRLGLSEEVVEDLRLAGELHDLGKIDSRFQAQMLGHDPVLIAGSDQPLAKSVRGARTYGNKWPPVRHEISSVALVQSSPDLLARAHDSDLVLHLVGTHHGHGRPLPPIRKDDCPQQLTAEGQLRDDGFRLGIVGDDGPVVPNEASVRVRLSVSSDLAETPLALEMADRFWRLQERYGHHGLAWLEAIFRLADRQRSVEEARERAEESR